MNNTIPVYTVVRSYLNEEEGLLRTFNEQEAIDTMNAELVHLSTELSEPIKQLDYSNTYQVGPYRVCLLENNVQLNYC